MREFFEVYIPDNLEKYIMNFFHEKKRYTSKMFESLLNSVNSEKKKNAISNQLQMTLPENIDSLWVI